MLFVSHPYTYKACQAECVSKRFFARYESETFLKNYYSCPSPYHSSNNYYSTITFTGKSEKGQVPVYFLASSDPPLTTVPFIINKIENNGGGLFSGISGAYFRLGWFS